MWRTHTRDLSLSLVVVRVELIADGLCSHHLRISLRCSLVNPTVLEKVVRYVVTNGQVEVDGQPLPEAKQKKYVVMCR